MTTKGVKVKETTIITTDKVSSSSSSLSSPTLTSTASLSSTVNHNTYCIEQQQQQYQAHISSPLLPWKHHHHSQSPAHQEGSSRLKLISGIPAPSMKYRVKRVTKQYKEDDEEDEGKGGGGGGGGRGREKHKEEKVAVIVAGEKGEGGERASKISSSSSSSLSLPVVTGHVVSSEHKTVDETSYRNFNCLPRVKVQTKSNVNQFVINAKMSKDQSGSSPSTAKPTATVKGTSTVTNEQKSPSRIRGGGESSSASMVNNNNNNSSHNNLQQQIKSEPSVAKVSPILQSKRANNENNNNNNMVDLHVNEINDKQVNNIDLNGDCLKSDEDNCNVNIGSNDENGSTKNGNNNDDDQLLSTASFGVKPLGPLKIHETGNYGLNDLYCSQANCLEKSRRNRSDCGRRNCRLPSRSSSTGPGNHHSHRSHRREDSCSRSPCYRGSSGGSPRKCRRPKCDSNNSYMIDNNNNSIEDR